MDKGRKRRIKTNERKIQNRNQEPKQDHEMITTPKVNEIQEAAEDVRRYFRVFNFDSRMFKIVIRPEIDDRIEEVTALRQQLGHVSLWRKER